MIITFNYNLLSVFLVNLLATTGDVLLSWTSPVYPKLYSTDTSINPIGRPITGDEDSWLGSLLTIGAVVGPFPYSFIAGKFGRKISLLLIAVPHIASFVILAFARNIYLFYFCRILGGLAMGGGYSVIPMYIAEISKDSNRGMMSLSLTVFWAIGNFLPYAIGPFISIMWFNIILACIPTAFFIAFLIMGTETPYYLLDVNKVKEAEASLMKLRSATKDEAEKELENIKAHLKEDEDGHFLDILKRRELRKALIICLILIMAHVMTGFCAITFYLQPIFDAAHTGLESDISALTVGIAMLVSSFISPFLVDRLGRRILLISSCIGMCLALLMLGTFFYILDSTDHSTDSILWIPIFSLIFFIFAFNFGMCTIPWTLCSELFPSNVKEIAASTQSSVCWTTTFLVTKFFNNMNEGMGKAGTFWFFAGCSIAAALFSMLFVPETKGKSFSDIQGMLKYGSRKTSLGYNENPGTNNEKISSIQNGIK